jgi:hypothetical protein
MVAQTPVLDVSLSNLVTTLTNYNRFPSLSAVKNKVSLNLLVSETTKYYHIIILFTVCTAEYVNASINNIQIILPYIN